jgi:hypothetical protein
MASRVGLALLLLLASASCSSSSIPRLIEPEFRVRQVVGQIAPSRRLSSATEINLMIDIANRSEETITLKRVSLQSMGSGGFRIEPASRTYDVRIEPRQVQTVDIWVFAQSESTSIDPNAPVSVRGTAIFNTPAGNFRSVFIEPISEFIPRRRE